MSHSSTSDKKLGVAGWIRSVELNRVWCRGDAMRYGIIREYSVVGVGFTPTELTAGIRERVPEFRARYAPDERREIADS